MEESGAPGCQGRDRRFGGKPQKRKAGGFKVSAQVFQREQKTGAIPLLKHDSSRAGRELGGGGWQGIGVREKTDHLLAQISYAQCFCFCFCFNEFKTQKF